MKLQPYFTTVTPLSKTIAMIVFVILPILGFFYGVRFQQKLDEPLINNQLAPNTKTSSEFKDWKTYTNQPHGFSFKYPPEMDVNLDRYCPPGETYCKLRELLPQFSRSNGSEDNDAFSVEILSNRSGNTLEKVAKDQSSDYIVASESSEVIAGVKSIKQTSKLHLSDRLNDFTTYFIPIPKSNTIIRLIRHDANRLNSFEKDFSIILATVRFID